MDLENISNVPHIYSGTLRIAPRALQFLNFPQTPLRSFPRDAVSHLNISWFLPLPNPVSTLTDVIFIVLICLFYDRPLSCIKACH